MAGRSLSFSSCFFMLSRATMGRIAERARRHEAAAVAERPDRPLVGPEGFAQARRQFPLTLALLVVIVIVSVLTHL